MSSPFDNTAPIVPEKVTELLSNCVRFVHASLGVELDLTHETLPLLDHYVKLSREEMKQRPEVGPLVAETTGAYFGHVLAIEFGGLWRALSPDVHEWQLYFQPVFLLLNPIGVGYELLFEGKSHAGPSSELRLARDERAFVEARLSAMPEISHEDFYTFSTRFDVVQIAVEALRSAQREAGLVDIAYEWGDYEDELNLD